VGGKRGKNRTNETQIGLRELGRGLQAGWGMQGAKRKEGRGFRQKGPMLRVFSLPPTQGEVKVAVAMRSDEMTNTNNPYYGQKLDRSDIPS